MATLTQNGVQFNSVKSGSLKFSNWPLALLNQQGPDEDGGIVNAVDNDWNGAQLVLPSILGGNKTITQLVNYYQLIDKIQEEIYVLSAA